jgi:hypothetical protein
MDMFMLPTFIHKKYMENDKQNAQEEELGMGEWLRGACTTIKMYVNDELNDEYGEMMVTKRNGKWKRKK